MTLRNCFLLSYLFLISCSEQQARKPITKSNSSSLTPASTILKKINSIEELKIINYIKKDTFHDYIRSPYGFWYRYIIKDPKNSISPKKGDLVQISYEISDLKDQIIYSKQLNGIKDYKVDEEDFIPGIQQGLKLMKIGETIKFIIPSFNAYDIVGDGNKIGINKSIISIVTLINIK
ncbi:gliding motility-associated peptidyl-prolyl isomerase GldI [Flavobacteriaceae bacterium]|nr:gliding motility-associated peptidyl-prolyl isomerase GldI [Flavobacteriaceae bacterium]